MIRTLLATTALTILLGTGAIAQDKTPADTATPADATAPAESMAPANNGMAMGFDMAQGYQVVDTDNLATRLIDQPVYSSTGDDAEEIGNVTDLVFSDDGRITAVVIGVGGFLGIGEKSVAVDFGALEFTIAADNSERWVLPTTADQLTAAPDFVWQDDEPANLNNDAMAPAADNNAAMTPAAPADNAGAMAPATPADSNAMVNNRGNLPEGYVAVTVEDLTADNLSGAKVVGSDGEDIAEVGDIVLTEDGKIDAMLIDFGGFLGMGQKRVAVGMDNLQFATDDGGQYFVYVNFTKEQLEQQPEYNADTYSTARDDQRMIAQ
ncbi:PRC-barrel domain-containing protein [Devosia rhodophyticola]|uniref:PRC-barrel domain-containing protein n=1 Tax=Devosia rhodophyticola TaxID=3026423 RepID=A0ABY7YVJ8_9HYPH|nr:PRC-barrel domain-containing protein [Devosia rhodophyticola]WDR04959.1 PRC-barrel domain-containing protein [Devosia rhodophyticola]